MRTREFPGVEKSFVTAPLKSDDGREAEGEGEEADQKSRQPPRLNPIVET
jgi:hypothetical protein